MYLIHGDETSDIADDSHAYGTNVFAVSQFHEYPNRLFLKQVDGEHRHQNGETVDYAQYYQFVLDGHDTKISEEKAGKMPQRNHKRREYAWYDTWTDFKRTVFLAYLIVSVVSLASI